MNDKTIVRYKNEIGEIVFSMDSPYWVEEIDGVSGVDVDIVKRQSAGQVGSTITSQNVKPRQLTMDGALFEPLSQTREQLIRVFAPQTESTLTIEENGVSFYLIVTPEKTPEITEGVGIQYFQTRLVAAYPYWRSTDEESTSLISLLSMFKFPFKTGKPFWISRQNQSYYTSVENTGNVDVDFTVFFTASAECSNPELTHVETGKKIKINKTMNQGEVIRVSTVFGKKGVVCIDAHGAEANGFKYLSVESDLSMAIIPGLNTFRTDAVNRSVMSAYIIAPRGVRSGV